MEWSGKRFGVGQSWLGADKGGELGSWAKYMFFILRARQVYMNLGGRQNTPLHLAASSSLSSPPIPPAVNIGNTDNGIFDFPRTTCGTQVLIHDCLLPRLYPKHRDTSTWASNALGNLWAVCCTGELGRYVAPLFSACLLMDWVRRLHETTAVRRGGGGVLWCGTLRLQGRSGWVCGCPSEGDRSRLLKRRPDHRAWIRCCFVDAIPSPESTKCFQ